MVTPEEGINRKENNNAALSTTLTTVVKINQFSAHTLSTKE